MTLDSTHEQLRPGVKSEFIKTALVFNALTLDLHSDVIFIVHPGRIISLGKDRKQRCSNNTFKTITD